jgi:hypothetical protein
MRRAGEPDQRGDAGAFPPLRVFLALMAVLVAIGGLVLLTREDDPPSPTPRTSASPNFALTDAEAIARFKELRALRDQMYRQRDLSLTTQIYTPDSPSMSVALREIRRLLRDDVIDRSTYRTHDLAVDFNSSTRIRIVEDITLIPRFVTSEGTEVTRRHGTLRQVVVWVLVEDGGQWLVYESSLKRSERKRA